MLCLRLRADCACMHVCWSACRHMAAQEAQAARDFGTSLQQQGMGGDFGDMWGLPPEDVGRSPRSPQQIWSSLSARDKRDLTRKVMARRTPTQAQVGGSSAVPLRSTWHTASCAATRSFVQH